MQFLWIAALFIPAAVICHGRGKQPSADVLEDGGSGDFDHPAWTHQKPPWAQKGPPRRRRHGNPWELMKGPNGNGLLLGRQRGDDDQTTTEAPGDENDGSDEDCLRPGWEFFPVFKFDNVTVQNATDLMLKEGENVFLMPKDGGRGHHHHHHRHHHRHHHHRHHMERNPGHPEDKVRQYVKLIYNSTEPDKVSIEYGLLKLVPAATTSPPTTGPSKFFGRPQRPSGGNRWPAFVNPPTKVFSPIAEFNNMTVQNFTDLKLKEGENIFLTPKGRKFGPPQDVQYVRLNYTAAEPDKVSIEYGLLKFVQSDAPSIPPWLAKLAQVFGGRG